MPTEFNPFESTFDPAVDPTTADTHALQIIEKLEEGKKLLASHDNPEIRKQVHKKFVNSENKLKANLDLYQKSIQKSGRAAFSNIQEANARRSAADSESLARYAVKLLESDEATFKSIVEENGDSEAYAEDSAFISDAKFLRDDYIKNKLLQKAGYSEREISGGVGEILARDALGAYEESSEPTNGAFSRWSKKLINEVDRRERVAKSATELATIRFLGMSEDKDVFEKDLKESYPHLTDSELVELRAMRVVTHAQLGRRYKTIKPLVIEAFNSLAQKEGFESDFLTPEDGEIKVRNFWEIAQQIVKDVPEEDYPALVAMLARTSEFHGNNPVSDMDSFSRGFAKSAKRLGRNLGLGSVGHIGDYFEKNAERRKSPLFRKVQDGFGRLVGVQEKMDAVYENSERSQRFSHRDNKKGFCPRGWKLFARDGRCHDGTIGAFSYLQCQEGRGHARTPSYQPECTSVRGPKDRQRFGTWLHWPHVISKDDPFWKDADDKEDHQRFCQGGCSFHCETAC